MAPKPKPVTAVNKWDEQLAQFATEAAETETVGGNFVSTRGGRLSVGGNEVPGNKMNVVVIESVKENHYYADRFDPDNPSSPVCFAFGVGEDEMVPHPDSTERQADKCANCPMNQFGSADQGRGKACKNIRRLGIITEDGLDDVPAAELAVLKIPVTSVKNWSTYVTQVATTLRRPPFAMVTEVSVVPDSKTQFKVCFKAAAQITDGDSLQALMDRKPLVVAELTRPYAPAPAEEVPQKPSKPSKVARR